MRDDDGAAGEIDDDDDDDDGFEIEERLCAAAGLCLNADGGGTRGDVDGGREATCSGISSISLRKMTCFGLDGGDGAR